MVCKKPNIITVFLCLLSLFGLLIVPILVLAASLSQDDDPVALWNWYPTCCIDHDWGMVL